MRFTRKPITASTVLYTTHKLHDECQNPHVIMCYDRECTALHVYAVNCRLDKKDYLKYRSDMYVSTYSIYINEDGVERIAHVIDCYDHNCSIDHYNIVQSIYK